MSVCIGDLCVLSWLTNYAIAFMMIVSLVSAIGDYLDEVLETHTGQPWVAVIQIITKSQPATITLLALMYFKCMFMSINQVTTSSR